MEKRKEPVSIRNRRVRKTIARSEEDAREHEMKKKAHLLQMILWVGVILLQMAVVGNMEVHAQEPDGAVQEEQEDRMVVLSEIYQRREDCPLPGSVHVAEDGTKYPLLSWEIECIQVPVQRRAVKTEGICGPLEGISQIPESIMVTAWEGEWKTEASCRLKEMISVKEEWQEDFSFPVTFHRYDAEVYRLGDRMIPGNKESPWFKGCEELLLQEIGVSPEEYQVTEVRWNGEPYEDENGELCRDAKAFGRKLVRDYRLVYEGTAEFPAHEAWRTAAVYGIREGDGVKEAEETIREDVVVSIEEAPSAAGAFSAAARLWERITQTLLLTIGLGAVLFFAGLLILAALWLIRSFRPYGRKGKTMDCVFEKNEVRCKKQRNKYNK